MTAASSHPYTRHRMAVVGMFDGVHLGHQFLLGQLLRLADAKGLTPLVLTFANHPMSVISPGNTPKLLTDAAQKRSLLTDFGVECDILEFTPELRMLPTADFMLMLRQKYHVDALLMGYDNRFGHNAPRDFDAYSGMAASAGLEICVAEEYLSENGQKISSTEIRRKLLDGDPAGAAALLGRPFVLSGTVTEGRHLGRTIGFPTANLTPLSPDLLVPAPGVYITRALGLPAVTNIGYRPTVDHSANPVVTIETHIIGTPPPLPYGASLGIAFRQWLRPELRFDSLDALSAQLMADREAALAF